MLYHAPSTRLAGDIYIVASSSSSIGQAIAYGSANANMKVILCHLVRRTVDGKSTPTHKMVRERFGKSKAVFKRTDVAVGRPSRSSSKRLLSSVQGRMREWHSSR